MDGEALRKYVSLGKCKHLLRRKRIPLADMVLIPLTHLKSSTFFSKLTSLVLEPKGTPIKMLSSRVKVGAHGNTADKPSAISRKDQGRDYNSPSSFVRARSAKRLGLSNDLHGCHPRITINLTRQTLCDCFCSQTEKKAEAVG